MPGNTAIDEGKGIIGLERQRGQEAIDLARSQSVKSWKLRTAMSLDRLWHSQGNTGEARDRLTPVYGWFTEGFYTADLKEAKALLDELS